MRRALALTLLLPSVAAACSRDEKPLAPKAFCEATATFERTVQETGTPPADGHTLDQAEKEERAKAQLPSLERVAAEAPEEIAGEVDTMVEGYEGVLDGEDISADEQRYDDAARTVERYYIERCGPLDKQPRSGI